MNFDVDPSSIISPQWSIFDQEQDYVPEIIVAPSEIPVYFLDMQSKEASSVVYYSEEIALVELSFNFTVRRSEIFSNDDHMEMARKFYENQQGKAKILISNQTLID